MIKLFKSKRQRQFDDCLEKAKQGDKEAQFIIYQCYRDGYVVDKNLSEAGKWLNKSIINGYAPAMTEKGNKLAQKTDKDSGRKAFELFEKADQLGDVDAIYHLGRMYMLGHGVERDIDKALSCYQKSFTGDLANPDSELYHVINDFGEERYRFKETCESALDEDPEALYELGCEIWGEAWYYDNKDVRLMWSRVLFEAAASFGNMDSIYELGRAYWFGYGIDINHNIAFSLWQYAAKKGNTAAMAEVGQCFTDKRDFSQAFKWYLKSAQGGDYAGRIYVAEFYLKGKGVEQNIEEALKWLKDIINDKRNGEISSRDKQWLQCAYNYIAGIYYGQFGEKYKNEDLVIEMLEKGFILKDRLTQDIAQNLSYIYSNKDSKYYNPKKANYYAKEAKKDYGLENVRLSIMQ